MSSRFLISLSLLVATALAACHKQEQAQNFSTEQPRGGAVVTSALTPGLGQSRVTTDARAAAYYNNSQAVTEGKRLYRAYNCSGCHSNGGGGMGPALMDEFWIYGSDDASVFETIARGRPNGMPAFGSRITESQIWMLAAYVESMSGRLPMDVLPSRADHMRYSTPENSRRARPPQGAPKGADE